MFTNQGTVIHFNNPKVQASLAANTFTITGHAETKQLTEMLPGILNQLGADSLTSLRRLAEAMPKPGTVGSRHSSWTVSAILGPPSHISLFFPLELETKFPWLLLKRKMTKFPVRILFNS